MARAATNTLPFKVTEVRDGEHTERVVAKFWLYVDAMNYMTYCGQNGQTTALFTLYERSEARMVVRGRAGAPLDGEEG